MFGRGLSLAYFSYQGFNTFLESFVEDELELAKSKLVLSDSNFLKTMVGLVDKFDSMDQAMKFLIVFE